MCCLPPTNRGLDAFEWKPLRGPACVDGCIGAKLAAYSPGFHRRTAEPFAMPR